MFGSIFRAWAAGRSGAKAVQVISRTYGLQLNNPHHISMMEQISQMFGDSLNEHEMAVQFLFLYAGQLPQEHPQARPEVERLVRIAKGVYARDLARSDFPRQSLYRVARERFGIEPDSIEAV